MSKSIGKGDLIKAIAIKSGLTQSISEEGLNAFLEVVRESLQAGEKITLPGFGVFSVGERAARTGRNPQTGKALKIPASRVAKFKAGSKLKEAVNS